MKKFSLYPFAIAASLFVLAACSDDDNDTPDVPDPGPEPVVPFGPKDNYTYIDGEGLAMTYNGEPLLGKMVKITPNTQDFANPTITLTGAALDLSQIMNQAAPTLAGRATASDPSFLVSTPGVLPGSPEVSFPITISETDGSFSGEGTTEYCSYKYSGTWSETDGMILQLSDVTLLDQTLGGTSWELPKTKNEDYVPGWEEYYGPEWNYTGIYVKWESATELDLQGWKMPIQSIIDLVFAFTKVEVGDQSVGLQTALGLVLNDITFTEDGNIIATYLDEETGSFAVSPKNIAQYVVDNGVFKLFLNPQAIMAHELAIAEQASRADDGTGLDVEAIMTSLMGLMQNYMPYVENGFPLIINQQEEGAMTLYLGTEFMMPIMSAAASLLSQPAIIALIKEAVADDPIMGSMGEMFDTMLPQLPGIVETTTALEVGLNLSKK